MGRPAGAPMASPTLEQTRRVVIADRPPRHRTFPSPALLAYDDLLVAYREGTAHWRYRVEDDRIDFHWMPPYVPYKVTLVGASHQRRSL